MHPLTQYDDTAALAPCLFGTAGWYAALARHHHAGMDFSMRYDKRMKAVHRFVIADHGSVRNLTVPVSRPEGGFASGKLTWGEILLSSHDRWWETIPTALESAYGRTPFYQFYAPKFASLYHEPAPGTLLSTFLTEADNTVRGILGLPPAPAALPPDAADLRTIPATASGPREYWQVQGEPFIPGLSILDLIFNQGPEAPLYLK